MTSNPEGRRERQVLVLQGGGALGAYQAGVFEALHHGGHNPTWLAGISIGAINAALIAGNPPERRVERLREFWELASSTVATPALFVSEAMRPWFSELSANWIAAMGVPGFFSPRFLPPILQPPGTPAAISFYDTAPLRSTLERLVDFDRINSDHIRLSVGAVNVTTGNFVYFDSARQRIGPEHVMASGALPPGFPPVEIEGELYWDGGLVSNTPMQYVLDEEPHEDLLVFQVDLFSARGEAPRTLIEAAEREKDIRFSSRTRLNTDTTLELHRAKALVRKLLACAPARAARRPAPPGARGLQPGQRRHRRAPDLPAAALRLQHQGLRVQPGRHAGALEGRDGGRAPDPASPGLDRPQAHRVRRHRLRPRLRRAGPGGEDPPGFRAGRAAGRASAVASAAEQAAE